MEHTNAYYTPLSMYLLTKEKWRIPNRHRKPHSKKTLDQRSLEYIYEQVKIYLRLTDYYKLFDMLSIFKFRKSNKRTKYHNKHLPKIQVYQTIYRTFHHIFSNGYSKRQAASQSWNLDKL